MPKHEQRRDRLVRPRLQLRLIMAFLAVAATALLFQFALFASAIATVAADLPQDGRVLLEQSTSLSLVILAVSLGVLLPLCFFVGVLVTFRVAGPLYRFEKHLEAVARGEDPGTCRIRKGDELHEFCDVLNSALNRVRERGAFRELQAEPATVDEAA
ncbi:MAG: hypothetical protein JNK02_02150 [Planctomycetes bacterium]|nr:hypothetical protein [Planctomycetota bacterium]